VELESVAAAAAELLAAALGPEFEVAVERSSAQTGSGSQPEIALESRAVAVVSSVHSADAIAARFRSADPPIVGRIERDRFLLDVRTVDDPSLLVPRAPEHSPGA
jgi:L-seryl-tRNA(Ser) seleniumtransferase